MLSNSQQLDPAFSACLVSALSASRAETGLTIADIHKAADQIAPYIRRTPVVRNAGLGDKLGTNIYLKLELLQKTAAFKVRGAFNKILSLSEAELTRGIVAVSAGNHAQAVAYAANKLGHRALILMPEATPVNYIEKTRGYGAEVELFPTLSDAFAAVKEYELGGYVYVHPFDDPLVIAGQGTIGLEIMADVPAATDIVVSIGGGGLACGIALAAKALNPEIRIWGVETRGADAMARALDAGRIVELPNAASIARTLCAPAVGHLNFELAKELLEGVTVVDDAAAIESLFYLLDHAKVLAEPAASCTLAAAEVLRPKFDRSSHVVLVLCGGNIGMSDLFDLAHYANVNNGK
ncbi:MAG TPA: threonine/serine dehydratase [Pyrinomonadaceae bacterium]|nr:threonine/serine dehydratase [Pyrinomonadaceae bacterium]